jgi:hypothetical protein
MGLHPKEDNASSFNLRREIMAYYLRIGTDDLNEAERHTTLRDAVAAFREVANELGRYDQRIDASVHIAAKRSECDEYPDYVLSVGPRGGVRCERT